MEFNSQMTSSGIAQTSRAANGESESTFINTL